MAHSGPCLPSASPLWASTAARTSEPTRRTRGPPPPPAGSWPAGGGGPLQGGGPAGVGGGVARARGGHVGRRGGVADAAMRHGAEAHGVITEALQAKEVAHEGLTSLKVVKTMHERKAAIADAADAFVMLPGGFGTFDEFFEVLTWTQLGIHAKPCGILDAAGFFGPLRALVDGAVAAGFVHPAHRDMIVADDDAGRLLDRLAGWTPVTVSKLMDPAER